MSLDNIRQPKSVREEISGETLDLQDRWRELYRWLDGRFANVDFEVRSTTEGTKGEVSMTKATFLCYPFAVND